MPITQTTQVIQADREAAGALLFHVFGDRFANDEPIRLKVVQGESDDHPWIQAFAAHRLQSIEPLVEALKAIVRDFDSETSGEISMAEEMASIDELIANARPLPIRSRMMNTACDSSCCRGRIASQPGSHASHSKPSAFRPSGFDPLRGVEYACAGILGAALGISWVMP